MELVQFVCQRNTGVDLFCPPRAYIALIWNYYQSGRAGLMRAGLIGGKDLSALALRSIGLDQDATPPPPKRTGAEIELNL